MRTHIDLIRTHHTHDAAGFDQAGDIVVASVRADVEHRHATPAWVNRSAYSKATALFRIRAIPAVVVDESMLIAASDGRWVIDSVEKVGRYLEITAHQEQPEGG